jgi:arabinose operon protein AraL
MLGFIVDLDGTVYRGGRLLAGSSAALDLLRELGHRIVFVTNNSVANPADYQRKLTGLGVQAAREEVISTNEVIAAHLVERGDDWQPVLAIGEEPLEEALRAAGLRLTAEWQVAGSVALGWDRRFTYRKLEAICRARAQGTPVVATNPDAMCPVEDGEVPDCGALIAAVERATGRPLEEVVGKPSPIMADAALARLRVDRSNCWVVGDRLETDIAMARTAGLQSALVLTGVSTRASVAASAHRPTQVCDDLAAVARFIVEGE